MRALVAPCRPSAAKISVPAATRRRRVSARLRAGALAPSLYNMDYNDINAMLGVGGMIEDQGRAILGDEIDRFNYNQNLPYMNLNQYANVIQGMPGGYGTTTTSAPRGGALQGAMGGAMLGAGLPGMLGPAGLGMMAAAPPMWPFLLGGAALGGLLS